MRGRACVVGVAMVAALNLVSCVPRPKPPALPSGPPAAGATLWREPTDMSTRDLYHGAWGPRRAPDPNAVYTFVERKHSGVNPGLTVVDPQGREWSVKQPFPGGAEDEGPVEVALSRVLSAIGYHQPPVHYLSTFTLKDDWGTHAEIGGRFRLKEESLKELGPWRWEDNPFVGSKPYQGLLVILMMFNSTDLKDSNNSIYERRDGERVEQWYAVRDIGSGLGDTNRFAPHKNHPDAFERHPFILGVGRHVDLAHDGWYAPLVRDRITPDDVTWASRLLARLSDRQWQDAFRAGSYEPEVANRFIRKLREKVRQGQEVTRRAAAR